MTSNAVRDDVGRPTVKSTPADLIDDLGSHKADRVTLTYLLVAGGWILVSGPAVDWIARRTTISLLTFELVKGLAFVVVTALVLRFVLRRWVRRVESAAMAERDAAAQLRQAGQERTAFLNGVSHELRTPLTAIVGYSHTLDRAARGGQALDTSDLTDRLVANATRLEWLVLDLLETSKLRDGVSQTRFRRVELSELLTRIADSTDFAGRRVELTGDPVEVDVDVPKLERCLQLLFSNCIRHTPDSSEVTVAWYPDGDHLKLTIDDDGPGLPEQVSEQVFAPFVQGDQATQAPSPGIGVGLTLVEQYVRLHDGEVSACTRPSGGTRVQLRLPRRQPN